MKFLSLTLALGLLWVAPLHAETLSAQRIKALRQLLPLKKVTVGPEDQFQATVSPNGQYLVFTHKADLVAHLRLQNLNTGQVTELLPLDADSQDANFAPDGRLAFTYYKFNARGDICYLDKIDAKTTTVMDKDLHCLRRASGDPSSERSSPFWRATDEIGYVVRDINTQNTRIVSENLRSHAVVTLAEGKVWAPAMKMNGRFLAYSSVGSESHKRFLMVRDLKTNQGRQVRLSLPGISGFSSISDDERFVYFSHFLNDTNGDNAIDGKDNAVVFRLPIDRIFSGVEGAPILPEQLTSVESSCSFPRPFSDQLFVTCAFESTLDIYQIPATGAVPASWDRTVLDNAYKTSRSYADRVLILDTMLYRLGAGANLPLDEDLLSNHILAGDNSAARFYLSLVEAQAPPADRVAYQILSLDLEAQAVRMAQPPGEITRAFQMKIQGLLTSLNKIPGEPRLHAIVRGRLLAMLGSEKLAIQQFEKVPSAGRWRAMEHYLYFQLAEVVFAAPHEHARLLAAYRQLMMAPELSLEARVYYGFNALAAVEAANHDPKVRIRALEALGKGLPADVHDLIESEIAVLRVVQEPDYKAKLPYYKTLDGLMRKATADYFLRKAMNVRSILNFNAFVDFQSISFMAANWLRDTAATDTEFFYAREVVSTASLDQAYGYYAQNKMDLASNYFYESLSLVDDLESHAGYVRTMVARGQRKTVDSRYQYLVSHHAIEDNYKFVQALLLLVDSEAAKPDDNGTKELDQALKLLNGMDQDRDSAVRYLLIGYADLEKLRRTTIGVEFDNALFQETHRALMLAYDQGRDNDRVREAALMNLGLLHQRSGNFGLSAKFLSLRKKLGFETDAAHAAFAWIYARSLFHSYQIDLAAKEIGDLPAAQRTLPLRERQAFYLAMSGDAKSAAAIYAEVLKSGQVQGAMNVAKINLGYGYALFKLKREAEAQAALNLSLKASEGLKQIPKSQTRVLDFEPLRLRLIAAGLLGQLGTKEQRVAALKLRGELLKGAKEIVDGWEPAVIQNDLRLADLDGDADATAELKSALQVAREYAKTNGYLGNAIYRTAVDTLVHAVLHPNLYSAGNKDLRDFTEKSLEAMRAQKPAPTRLSYEQLKLEILWNAYQAKVDHDGGAKARLSALLASEDGKKVQEDLPPKFAELEALVAAVN